MKAPVWSDAEDAIIAEEIKHDRIGWCTRVNARLPKRTLNAIKTRAYTANIVERVRTEHMRESIAERVANRPPPAPTKPGAHVPDYLRDLPIWDKPRP